ncbi:MAG TPA: HD domain-containing protein, partial [Microvirga sp.]|nr:HD domain-containing protein [Microvirga sp.]
MGEVSMLSGRRWAKSGRADDEDFHDLLAHGLDVAAVLQVGLQSRPALVARIADALEMSTAATLAFLGAMAALHDVGKAAASFQFLDPALARRLGLRRGICADYDRNRNGHDRIGHAILDEIAREGGLFSPAIPRAQAEEIIGVFAYHHGAAKAPGGDDCYLSADRDYALSMVRLVKELFGWDGTAPDVARLRPMSYLINGALNLADWIGSDSRIAYVREVADPAGYLRRAREQAAELIRLIRPSLFTQPDVPEPLSFDELFPEFAGHGWTP